MARWRKGGESTGVELEVYSSGQGLVVQGSTTDVSLFVDEMMALTRQAGGRGRHLVVDGAVGGLQVAANVVAYRQTHREYFEFSERALALMKEHGAIPTQDGWFRSFVHDGKHLAGNLDWRSVDLSPEQALSMQTMAGQLALRAAIKDVVAAIERVEGKVDKVIALAKAERLGRATADRNTLLPLVQQLRTTGELYSTDWDSVASLGPLIAQDIETLRAYILGEVKKVSDSRMVHKRAAGAQDLADQLVSESLALLVVVEQNYALWQELRIGHAAVHERKALVGITKAVRDQLEALTRADQDLVHRLSEAIVQLTAPTGYEGLAPLKKGKLKEHAENLTTMRTWFADQRHLDYDNAELPDYPGLGESLSKVGRVISTTVRTVTDTSTRPTGAPLPAPKNADPMQPRETGA